MATVFKPYNKFSLETQLPCRTIKFQIANNGKSIRNTARLHPLSRSGQSSSCDLPKGACLTYRPKLCCSAH